MVKFILITFFDFNNQLILIHLNLINNLYLIFCFKNYLHDKLIQNLNYLK